MKAKLFVQGGGMRGVYSLAALARLEQLGLTDRFDVVEGASAGAMNGTYFITGQAKEALGIYAEIATARQFIRYHRVHRILDVDFLIDTVLKRDHPLKVDRYLDSPIEMRTVLTDAHTATPLVITNRMPHIDVYELLRATAAVPLLYHRKVPLNGRHYVDGAVSQSLPYLPDLDGDRPYLAVLTQPLGFRVQPPTFLVRAAIALRSASMSAGVRRHLHQNFAIYNTTMTRLESFGPQSPVRVVAPADRSLVANRTTRSPELIRSTIQQGGDDLERAIEGCAWL
jgi:predicted patatin/cPLA2 family phospholipase